MKDLRPPLSPTRRRLSGLVLLLVMVLVVVGCLLNFNKVFKPVEMVTLQTDTVGNQLSKQGDVKVRGVIVGEIKSVDSDGTRATIQMAMDPDALSAIPSNVTAQLIPKTLFGERYVQLSVPAADRTPPLRSGDVIAQDHSANAIELERVFDNLLPLLQAVQPQKLATTLTAVSTALQGRGAQLGQTLAQASDYLKRFNPDLPRLDQNVHDLATVSNLYGDIAPDLLDALSDSAVTLGTVNEKRGDLGTLYQQVTASSGDITTFLQHNGNNIISLSADSRRPLEIAAEYSPSFPCTLQALTDLKPDMNKVLGAGTNQPGLHAEISVTQSRGKYVPGQDAPAYTATGGPRCYPSGVVPTTGTAAAAPGTQAHPLLPGADGDLGVANSPQEQELLATLVAPSIGVPTGQVPAWGSVLVGPLYRGTEVKLK